MKEVLAKRLSFFAQILVVIWIISMFAWIQKIEAYDLRDDVFFLNALENISASNFNFEQSDRYPPGREYCRTAPSWDPCENYTNDLRDFQNIYSNIRDYLKTEKSNIFDLITGTREEVTEWLKKQGCSKNTLKKLTGKNGSNKIPFYFFDFLDNQNLKINSNKQEITVSDFLNKLEILVRPQKILAVERIEKLVPSIDFTISDQFSPGVFYLDSVKLSDKILKITFEAYQGISQIGRPPRIINVPVKVQEVNSLPILSLFTDSNRTSNDLLLKLSKNKEEMNVIQQTYGILPLKEAKDIASSGLIEAYKKINILGFSISARKLPWAVLFFSLVFMFGTFLTIKKAKKRSLRLISSVTDERAIDILIDNKISRAILWCGFPVLSVIMSLPIIELSSTEMSFITILCILLFFLGFKSTCDSWDL